MINLNQFYIDGKWTAPASDRQSIPFFDPSTEQAIGSVALAEEADVNAAVASAAAALPAFAALTVGERIAHAQSVLEVYQSRLDDIAQAVSLEMGAPLETVSKAAQAPLGLLHLQSAIEAAEKFEWQHMQGDTLIAKEPVGVCAMITPWNWPLNQIVCKVAPAIISGCTMVLKPSEMSPYSAKIFAEVIDASTLPAGVFNMIQGDGAVIGPVLSSHPGVDMVSLTGSQRAGSSVSKCAADTVKRVSLELGGKSANIVLPDADLEVAVQAGVAGMVLNSGQSCNAPSRMFVHESQLNEVESIAAAAMEAVVVGPPSDPATTMGPIANQRQFQRVQSLIQSGIDEGAKLVVGGTGLPDGISAGYFVKPTVFSEATNDMKIAREEIFGPVLTIIPYKSEEEAIEMANDTAYGLSGYVWSGSIEKSKEVALKLRTGMVHINGAPFDITAPFGGYKQSGNGREWGAAGIEEFVETKAMMGAA